MTGLIEGKVAIITGAGSGVGRAATLLFARHGAKVIAADVDQARAEETVAEVKAAGGEATALRVDVGQEAEAKGMIKAAVDAYGRLDILYNNAGITINPVPGKGMKRLTEVTEAEMLRVQAVNVNGVFFACQAAIEQFGAQGGNQGVIVNTASVAGLVGYGGVVYGATKGAITSMTRTLALEVSAQGIRVNSVCPGGMPTRYAGQDPDGPNAERARQSMSAAHPLGRPIEPEDCANGALFLASDLASNITGVNLPIDGGLTAGPMPRR